MLDGVRLTGTVGLASGSNTGLNVDNGITGTGTILLGGASTSAAQLQNFKANSFHPVVVGAGITVRGGSGAITRLENYGTVHAEPGATIALGSQSSTNAGTLKMSAGGRITSRDLVLTESSRVEVDVGGPPSGGAYGAINSTGAVALDGVFAPSTSNGYVPAPADVFRVMTSTSRTGRFDPLALTPLAADRSFQPALWRDARLAAIGRVAIAN